MNDVVVRFAPSPTGYLHIGGARTAIFNWLYARKHNGKFILRIEDTDADRSTADAIEGILEGLSWLGMDWDEGPNFQSHFVEDHRVAAQQLVNSGAAYKCFCDKAMLDQKRSQAQAMKTTYQYDGSCRELTSQQIVANENDGKPFVIRFRVPRESGAVIFEDAVYGRIEKQYSDIEDFIIVRANGQPLYVLSNAVDDIRDGVTHVIRGQDGLANTPKQILIYRALQAALPQFAHMSLTLDPQKAKISKRKHGQQVSVQYYRENGFLPWAMVNFLVLLGWSTSDSQEIFTKQELIDRFQLRGIGRANSVFNIKTDAEQFFSDPKLLNMNSHYIRTMPMDELMPFVELELKAADIWDPEFDHQKREWLAATLDLIRERYLLLTDFVTYGRAYLSDSFSVDHKAARKNLHDDASLAQWLPELIRILAELERFDTQTIENELKKFLSHGSVKPGKLVNAVRTAVTGQGVGPDILKVIACIGQERVVSRLKAALEECSASHN